MSIVETIILSLLQGLTEFLPVSSSAHLILLPKILGMPDQGLAFDIAVHVGTLLAVVYYFRKEIKNILHAFYLKFSGKLNQENDAFKMGLMLLIGTIPVGIIGFISKESIATQGRSAAIIALATIIFALLLFVADKKSHLDAKNRKISSKISYKNSLLIGLAQAIALIPGTSRSGITLTAGLLCGLERKVAAKYSFLLSIPVIILAGISTAIDIFRFGVNSFSYSQITLAIFISAISAFICINTFMRIIEKLSLNFFVIYRLILGLFILLLNIS